MYVTLHDASQASGLASWLLGQGFPSRPLAGGRALLIQDALVPAALRSLLGARPEVAALEPTHDLPPHATGAVPATTPPIALLGLPVVAGPCSIESAAHIHETAHFLAGLGVSWLRGGTNKTRTRPDLFQGKGLEAAEWLRAAADAHGMRCVSELTEGPDLEGIGPLLDVVQVGARHMHAPRFLQRVGALGKPVLLKRGFAAEPLEWLWAAEYLLTAGAPTVIFCERGLRTASPLKRFTLDLAAVPMIQQMTPFPIWVDPSHAAGSSPYVAPLARAAIAAGAQAVIIECHPEPGRARSDAAQALDFSATAALVAELGMLARPTSEAPQKAGAR